MKQTTLAIAVIVLGLAVGNVMAAKGGEASQSTKSWLSLKKSEPERGNLTQAAMRCGSCKVTTLAINEQIATKPGYGRAAETVTTHQCPSCGTKMIATSLKQTQLIHTCGSNASAVCCTVS